MLQPGGLGRDGERLAQDPSLGLVGPALVTPVGDLQPSGRAFPTLRRSSFQAVLGVLLPKNPYSRRYRDANRVTGGNRDCGLGDRSVLPRSPRGLLGGRRISTTGISCTSKKWISAGGSRGQAGAPAIVHRRASSISPASTAAVPYRMIVAHHLSLWRFARRTTCGFQRILLPIVAAGIAGRCAAVCLRRVVVQLGQRR